MFFSSVITNFFNDKNPSYTRRNKKAPTINLNPSPSPRGSRSTVITPLLQRLARWFFHAFYVRSQPSPSHSETGISPLVFLRSSRGISESRAARSWDHRVARWRRYYYCYCHCAPFVSLLTPVVWTQLALPYTRRWLSPPRRVEITVARVVALVILRARLIFLFVLSTCILVIYCL